MASIRTTSVRTVSSFTATAPKQSLRRLHITGSNATPTYVLQREPAVTQAAKEAPTTEARPPISTRHFNTSRALKAVKDSSTIDFAYMPAIYRVAESPPEIRRIPLLPDNYHPARNSAAAQEAVEEVIRPQIETASADGTNVVSAMSEVTDNDSQEMDPFELTSQVGKAAKRGVGTVKEVVEKQKGAVSELWSGFVDDLLGEKKGTRPA